jgi:hypothetical protein
MMLTVDSITGGNRERDLRTGFSIPFKLTLGGMLQFAIKPMWAINYLTHERFKLPQLDEHVDMRSGAMSIGRYFTEMLDPSMNWSDVADMVRLWNGQFSCRQSVGDRREVIPRRLPPPKPSAWGREEGIAMLTRRWERARQSDGQLVLIVGEPGLGKSRLVDRPLHPIAEWGRQRFGGTETTAQQQLADLESSLAQVTLDPTANVPLLAPLLDIPLPPKGVPSLPPEETRRRQLAALTNWVIAGARSQPIVLALEDVHWADPTTLDLLRGIAERGALAPLFVLVTARPEFRPPWGARSHHGTISLVPLDRQQVREMVAELSARHALSKEVVDGVTERAGGVPLFVEEVTRLLLERGEQGGIQAIPPTLQQSLMARLDRLGPAREVAQVGAAIGRDFSYALLRATAGMEDAPLQIALERLAEADILLVQGYRQNLNIASSMRLFRTRLMTICSRAGAKSYTVASPRSCSIVSAAQLLPSRNCWRTTSPRRPSRKRPSNGGAKRDSGRWNDRRLSKPRNKSPVRSIKSRPCPAARHCVANRSSYRSRS